MSKSEKRIMVFANNAFRSEDGWTMAREYGNTENGNAINGRWVLRNETGAVVDIDKYRNDLEGRYGLKLTGDA